MGMIIKLPETFSNPDLPVLVDYDTTALRAQILALPSLRGFWDLTDPDQMTLTGALVDQVNDLSGNGLHLTASGADRPTFTAGAMNGQADGVVFGGAHKLSNATLFSGGDRFSMAAAFFADGADGTSRALFSDDSATTRNLYVGGGQIRAYGADVALDADTLTTEVHWAIAAVNAIGSEVVTLYTRDGTDTAATVRGPADGAGTVGSYSTGTAPFDGAIGALMILDEDLSANAAVRALIVEYLSRQFRI